MISWFTRLGLSLILVLLSAPLLDAQETRITINPDSTLYRMSGWQAATRVGQEFPAYWRYRDELVRRAVDELGINRLRLEVTSGMENPVNNWSRYRRGEITDAEWQVLQYSNVNDNFDISTVNPSGFHFAQLDSTIESLVLPMRDLLHARGQQLVLNVCYRAFTAQSAPGSFYVHDQPEEYAEFVLITCLHLREKYDIVPDLWEVMIAPDLVNQWSNGQTIGRAIVAAGRRLDSAGIHLRFVAPSTSVVTKGLTYFDELVSVPGALDRVAEFCYHSFFTTPFASLDSVRVRAERNGITSAMLEHVGGDYNNLFDDVVQGGASAWQQYSLAWLGQKTDIESGEGYFRVDTAGAGGRRVYPGSRTPALACVFRHVQAGAQRVAAASDSASVVPMAFLNDTGGAVVCVKVDRAGAVRIVGLPSRNYSIEYTTSSVPEGVMADTVLAAGEEMLVTMPSAGVFTVYASRTAVDLTSPTLRILRPHNNVPYMDGDRAIAWNWRLQVEAEAVDDDSVQWLLYRVNGEMVGDTLSTSPYAAFLPLVDSGKQEIQIALGAEAGDRAGNIGTTGPIHLTVETVFDTAVDAGPNASDPPMLSINGAWHRGDAGTVHVSFVTRREMSLTATISDLSGRSLFTVTSDRTYAGLDCVMEIDAQRLPPGGYVVQLRANGSGERAGETFVVRR